ncbi:MAG: hypothetical protein ACR2F8_13185 [Caulobacteraceae bacterium]
MFELAVVQSDTNPGAQMTLWAACRRTYAQSWRFMVALPLIALAVIGFEGLQHVLEWTTGMYRGVAVAKEVEHDPIRMIGGLLKIAWLLIVEYWVARFIVSGGSKAVTIALEPVAVRKFFNFFAFYFVLSAALLLLPSIFLAMGLMGRTIAIGVALLGLATVPLEVALAPWAVGSAIGDVRASPAFALGRSGGSVLWGLAFTVIAILPLMIVHYGFGLGAIGRSPLVAILLLLIDSCVVGFLGIVFNVSQVVIAERMALRAGGQLACRPA